MHPDRPIPRPHPDSAPAHGRREEKMRCAVVRSRMAGAFAALGLASVFCRRACRQTRIHRRGSSPPDRSKRRSRRARRKRRSSKRIARRRMNSSIVRTLSRTSDSSSFSRGHGNTFSKDPRHYAECVLVEGDDQNLERRGSEIKGAAGAGAGLQAGAPSVSMAKYQKAERWHGFLEMASQ